MRTYVASHLKDMNRKLIYNLICERGELSRSEISRITNISAPTVLKITNYLEQNNFIESAGEMQGGLGRKAQIFRHNPNFAYSLGIEYEGGYLKIGVVNTAGEIKLMRRLHVLSDFTRVLDSVLVENIEALISDAGISKRELLGVGIGIPGAVNEQTYEMRFGPLVGVYSSLAVKEAIDGISGKIGAPVYIFNDVNAAAMGEYSKRRLKEEDLVYISLGTGLGSGIILDGKLRIGKHFLAGEIGYMTYDSGYILSERQAGWMESAINLTGLEKKFGNFEVCLRDKGIADEILRYVSGHLSVALANIVNILDVELIVLGGVIVEMLGEPLMKAVNEDAHKLSLFDISIEKPLCVEPGIVGTALMVTNGMLDDILTKSDFNEK